MSRHEGVSCDACLKANFRGRRYKCLICYDYDLCSSCYESGSTTSRHTTEHPMQCILTRHDFDIFHGGEALTVDTPQSLTCPLCCKMGFTETTLQEHVAATHPDTAFEVVCPICASDPGGEPNHVTEDFAAHLTIDHRSGGSRELDVSESSGRQGARRVNHQGRGLNRGAVRQSMRFGSVGGGFFSSSPRESMDPIAELLSQLSGVRRATATTRQQQQQQLERLPARRSASNRDATSSAEVIANQSTSISSQTGTTSSTSVTVSLTSTSNAVTSSSQSVPVPASVQSSTSKQSAQQNFLIPRLSDSEADSDVVNESHNQAAFIQELLLSTLSELSLGTQTPIEELVEVKEVENNSVDVSTQTPASSIVSLGSPITPTNLPSFHTPMVKNPLMSVAPPLNKKSQKLVMRGPPILQLQSPNGANQVRIGSGANTPVGSKGNSRPQSGGAVSPTSRRKPMRGVEGGRVSQPPPPH